ncbi:MAG: hypothetical protein J6A90_04380 [Clostridia bacterium]|nr:hypothetical protein [Clostridia bacterium]
MYCKSCNKEENDEKIKSIIDKLYTLRAMISKVSVEIDKVRSAGCKLDRKKKEMLEFLEFYNDFYTSYLLMFDDIIDENNWKNIDLIIYMLESKRASTPNDALQQIDLHRHTEKMMGIDVAAETICNTILNEPNKIENAIISSISLINKEKNSYFKNSVITLELQNAMIEKNNATCKEMMHQIELIKQLRTEQSE